VSCLTTDETTRLFQKTIGRILEILDDNSYLAASTGDTAVYFDKAKDNIKNELWGCHDMVKLRFENIELKSKFKDEEEK